MTETTTDDAQWGEFVCSSYPLTRALEVDRQRQRRGLPPLSHAARERMLGNPGALVIENRRLQRHEHAHALDAVAKLDTRRTDAERSRLAIESAKLDARRDADEPATVIVAALVAAPGAPSLAA